MSKKSIELKICALNLSEKFLILSKNERNIAITIHRTSCEVLLFLSDFNQNKIFFTNREVAEYHM